MSEEKPKPLPFKPVLSGGCDCDGNRDPLLCVTFFPTLLTLPVFTCRGLFLTLLRAGDLNVRFCEGEITFFLLVPAKEKGSELKLSDESIMLKHF